MKKKSGNEINFFFPKNIYSLLISLGFASLKKKNIIFFNKNFFKLDRFLIKFIIIKYNLNLIHVKNYSEIIKNVKKIIKMNKIKKINFFHKELFNKLISLKKYKISHFFLEHGIGNYYNFATLNIFQRFVDLIKNYKNPKFKFYAGVYAQLNNDLFIEGSCVLLKSSNKIKKIINDLFLFHLKQYDYFQDLNKVFLEKKRVILLNLTTILNFDEFQFFLNKLNTEKKFKNNFYLIKLHPNEKQKIKYLNFTKEFFDNQNSEYLILDKKFDNIPFELFVSFSKNSIIYSSISNFPLVSSLIFKNLVFIYLPLKVNKDNIKFNEVRRKSYNFYKKNFLKISFI